MKLALFSGERRKTQPLDGYERAEMMMSDTQRMLIREVNKAVAWVNARMESAFRPAQGTCQMCRKPIHPGRFCGDVE